jgi:hypothetical protein
MSAMQAATALSWMGEAARPVLPRMKEIMAQPNPTRNGYYKDMMNHVIGVLDKRE